MDLYISFHLVQKEASVVRAKEYTDIWVLEKEVKDLFYRCVPLAEQQSLVCHYLWPIQSQILAT